MGRAATTPAMALAALAALAACAPPPAVLRTGVGDTANAPYPTLVPLDTLLGSVAPLPETSAAGPVEARAAVLRARAARLRALTPGA